MVRGVVWWWCRIADFSQTQLQILSWGKGGSTWTYNANKNCGDRQQARRSVVSTWSVSTWASVQSGATRKRTSIEQFPACHRDATAWPGWSRAPSLTNWFFRLFCSQDRHYGSAIPQTLWVGKLICKLVSTCESTVHFQSAYWVWHVARVENCSLAHEYTLML